MTFKVLVPLDGSRLAETSLVYLDALKSLGESEVLLVSVVDEAEDYRGVSDAESSAREANLLATYLREVSSDVEKHIGVPTDYRVLTGSPSGSILDEANRYAPDLIVISTHGRSGLARWRTGSVADKVIRGAACNTLVVGPRASERSPWIDARIMEPFRSILVPLDGSPLAEGALSVANSFATSYGSAVHLVSVVSIPVMDGFYTDAYVPNMVDQAVQGARSYLDTAAGRYLTRPAEKQVIIGTPALVLEDFIAEHGIDLVVMTSHGRGGFVRTALGSITDRLVGGAAPVLVVRPQE